jgi:hypothetical protein
MNMKIEENENNGKHNDSNKPKRKHDQGGNIERVIPKIDDKTPTSSILDLQKKLD